MYQLDSEGNWYKVDDILIGESSGGGGSNTAIINASGIPGTAQIKWQGSTSEPTVDYQTGQVTITAGAGDTVDSIKLDLPQAVVSGGSCTVSLNRTSPVIDHTDESQGFKPLWRVHLAGDNGGHDGAVGMVLNPSGQNDSVLFNGLSNANLTIMMTL